MGLQVVTSGAKIIGEVKGAKVDTATWAIKFLNVKLTGDAAESFGMKKRFRSSKICLPVSMVQAVGACGDDFQDYRRVGKFPRDCRVQRIKTQMVLFRDSVNNRIS